MAAEDRNGEVSTQGECTDCTTRERSFDAIARGLANGSISRRRALRLLGGALVGGAVASIPGVGWLAGSNGEAQAAPGDAPGGSTCSNSGQSCTAQKCCEGLSCLTDPTNSTEKFCCPLESELVCGSKCCPAGALLGCTAGKCQCPVGEIECPNLNNLTGTGKCVNLQEDVDNCGGCGIGFSCPEPTGADAPCRVRACVNGKCTTVANTSADGAPCTDGDVCTLNDTCQGGICKPGNVKVCDQCQKCANVGGVATCVPDLSQDDKPCEDGNKCTLNDTCKAGVCVSGPLKDCDDNNECTTDSCDPATGNCVHTKQTGTSCDTGNKCTADLCDNGVCKQGEVNVTCPQCQVCDTTTGTCKNVENGTSCEDGDVCTLGDTCQGGTCKSGPIKTCNECQVCADVGGVATCVANTSKNGTSCNDNLGCTTSDKCQDGVCTGTSTCTGRMSFCCGVGTTRVGTCQRPPGDDCSQNNQCCNACVSGKCT
jgi:hypothetical protein